MRKETRRSKQERMEQRGRLERRKTRPPLTPLAVVLSLTIFTQQACTLLTPTSTAHYSTDRELIRDPVAYEEALALVNEANRLFQRGDHRRAQQLVEESLQKHESFEGYYLQGVLEHRLGESHRSLTAFERAENLRPNDQQLLLTLGMVYGALGDPAAAQQRYLRLHRAYPTDPLFAFRAGVGYKDLGEYEKALELLHKADVEEFESRDQLYLQTGDTLVELKRYDEADRYFKLAREINPALEMATGAGRAGELAQRIDAGQKALEADDLDLALANFRAAHQISPTTTTPLILEASTLILMEQPAEARAVLERALKINAEDERIYSLIGSTYHLEERYSEAMEVFRRGMRIAPHSFEVQNKIGLLHRDIGERGQAIEAFGAAIAIRERYLPARSNLAYTLLDARRYNDARREFARALEISPDDEDLKRGEALVAVYQALDAGDSHLSQGRIDQAVREYERARSIDSRSALIFNSLGNAEFTRRNFRQAERHYRSSLELEEQNIPALQGLLRIYSAQRRTADQRRITAELRDLAGGSIYAGLAIGRSYEDESDLTQAERHYQTMQREHPESRIVEQRLAMVWYRQGLEGNLHGDYPRALQLLERAHRLHSELPEYELNLAIIRENQEFRSLIPQLQRAEEHYLRGRYRDALPIYERVYRQLKRPQILVRMANIHFALGDEAKAEELLSSADLSDGVGVEVEEAIANLQLRRGQIDAATSGFERVVAAHPDAYYSHYKLGAIELQKGRHNEAIEAFERSLNHKSDFAPAFIGRGVTLYQRNRSGDRARARDDFERGLAFEQTSPLANLNLGIMLYNDELLDQAEKIFRDLAAKHPELSDARYQLSYIHFSRGDFASAEREMLSIIERVPDEARYRYALVQIYEGLYESARSPGNLQKLRQAHQEMISRFSQSQYASESRSKLLTLNPDERVFHPFAIPAETTLAPVIFHNRMVVADGRQLRVIDAASRSEAWSQRTSSPIRSWFHDRFIHTLHESGDVEVRELSRGSLIQRFTPMERGLSLLGAYNQIGVVRSLGGGGVALDLYNLDGELLARSEAAAGSHFLYAAESFYLLRRVEEGAAVELSRLSLGTLEPEATLELDKGDSLLAAAAAGRLDFIAVDGRLYLSAAEAGFAVIDRDRLRLRERVERRADRLRLIRGADAGDGVQQLTIAVASGRELLLFDRDGVLVREQSLEVAVGSEGDIDLAADGGLLVVAQNGRIYRYSVQGELEWQEALPDRRRSGSALTLFY